MRILSFIKKMYTENCLKETTGMIMYRFQIVKAGELSGGRFCPGFLEAVWCRCGITGQGATIYFQRHRISLVRDPSQDPCLCLQKKDDFHKNYLWNKKSSGHVMWISRRVLCFSLVETHSPKLSFYDGKEINSKIKDVLRFAKFSNPARYVYANTAPF